MNSPSSSSPSGTSSGSPSGSAAGPLSGPLSLAAAAVRLHTTPRMLRYRESLGLLPRHRRRRYGSAELAAAAHAVEMEHTYDVSPKTLAFALRALTDTAVHRDLVRLGELTGRLAPRQAGYGASTSASSPAAGNSR